MHDSEVTVKKIVTKFFQVAFMFPLAVEFTVRRDVPLICEKCLNFLGLLYMMSGHSTIYIVKNIFTVSLISRNNGIIRAETNMQLSIFVNFRLRENFLKIMVRFSRKFSRKLKMSIKFLQNEKSHEI
jgi:hypothetical protein